mmetsp:Transcript_58047/g.154634  ORF Transcript_58047/g.154634 Transcript_58047/m.154634 type:complete len:146 (+) Transcript_58047:546-983(+)
MFRADTASVRQRTGSKCDSGWSNSDRNEVDNWADARSEDAGENDGMYAPRFAKKQMPRIPTTMASSEQASDTGNQHVRSKQNSPKMRAARDHQRRRVCETNLESDSATPSELLGVDLSPVQTFSVVLMRKQREFSFNLPTGHQHF